MTQRGSSRTRLVAACAAGLLLAACDDSPESAPPSNQVASPTTKVAPALASEMVAAVSSEANTKVVSVHFALNGSPEVNKALPVDIAIVPHQALTSLHAHFEARDGLALATGNAIDPQADASAEKVVKHQLVLLPGKEGVFMVTAIVDTGTIDGTVSRIFSIPVIVGPAGAAPAAATPAPTTNPASG
ncbi:MAG TPA: hypothetical protein VMF52_15960 [Steroidobacteraceae bacterium]|nr:hypothetical protein [Steroidobacteraceae bacterium]